MGTLYFDAYNALDGLEKEIEVNLKLWYNIIRQNYNRI